MQGEDDRLKEGQGKERVPYRKAGGWKARVTHGPAVWTLHRGQGTAALLRDLVNGGKTGEIKAGEERRFLRIFRMFLIHPGSLLNPKIGSQRLQVGAPRWALERDRVCPMACSASWARACVGWRVCAWGGVHRVPCWELRAQDSAASSADFCGQHPLLSLQLGRERWSPEAALLQLTCVTQAHTSAVIGAPPLPPKLETELTASGGGRTRRAHPPPGEAQTSADKIRPSPDTSRHLSPCALQPDHPSLSPPRSALCALLLGSRPSAGSYNPVRPQITEPEARAFSKINPGAYYDFGGWGEHSPRTSSTHRAMGLCCAPLPDPLPPAAGLLPARLSAK